MRTNQEQLVDAIRSLLYGTDDMLGEVYLVADLLAGIDGVPSDDTKNRLVVALLSLKSGYERANDTNLD